MSQLDDIVSYARNSVRERERSAAEHRVAHDAVTGTHRFALARRLFTARHRTPGRPAEEPAPLPELRHHPR